MVFSFTGVTNSIKYPVSSFIIWFVLWIWRRKAFLITIILFALLLIVCLEYKVSKRIVSISFSRQDITPKSENEESDSQRPRMVQFIGDEMLATRDSVVDVVGKNNAADNVKVADHNIHNKWNPDSSFAKSAKVSPHDIVF